MRLAFFPNNRTSAVFHRDMEWDNLAELLAEVIRTPCDPCPGKDCTHKFGPAWSPAHFDPPVRSKANAIEVQALVLDLDDLSAEDMTRVLDVLDPYEYVLHSTHANPTSEGLRARLVMRLAAPVSAAAWPAFIERVYQRTGRVADEACRDPSRLYFLPSCPQGEEYDWVHHPGEPYPVDTLPIAPAFAEPVDLSDIRAAVKDAARGADGPKKEALDLLRKGEPFPEGNRDNFMLYAVAALVRQDPPPTWEQVKAALAPSVSQMDDPAHWFVVARGKFDRIHPTWVEELRNRKDGEALLEVAKEAPGKLPFYVDGDGRLLRSPKNAGVVFEHHADWARLRWNVVDSKVEVAGTPIAGSDPQVAHTDAGKWLMQHFGLDVRDSEVDAQLRAVAMSRAFNPVAEYLNSLRWDGEDRASGFLFTYFGAETQVLVQHGPALLSAVSRKWLVSAVARAFRPGVKVDTTLILEGTQGIGKTTAFQILAGEWYSGSKFDMSNKDARMMLCSRWIVELQELASLRKVEVEALRAFLTETHDTFRPPYGRSVVTTPRLGVFVGTTNDFSDYLNDPAGNRRFWPIRATAIDLEALKRDRDQIWAQAVALYRAGEAWHLSPAESTLMELEREPRQAPVDGAAMAEAIARFYLAMAPESRPKAVTSDNIAVSVFGIQPTLVSQALLKRIDSVFENILEAEPARLQGVTGPGRRGRLMAHSRRKGWRLPAWLLEAPQGARLEEVAEDATERESASEL